MGRPKGSKSTNTYRTAKEKLEYIKPIINGKISLEQTSITTGIGRGCLHVWIKRYQEGGIEALENKRKPCNPLTKYSRRKELSYTEQLEYENMKLRIENERLKKGYTSKEVDQIKQKKSNKKNLK